MTTHNEADKGHPFIEQARELYHTDPVAAAIMLTDGVNNLLESRGLALSEYGEAMNGRNRHPGVPYPTVPEQRLESACRNLARTARDAAAGIAPEPDEWEMDVGIARSAIRLMAQVHG